MTQLAVAVCVVLVSACSWVVAAVRSSIDVSATSYTGDSLPSTWVLFMRIAWAQWRHFRRRHSSLSLHLPPTKLYLSPVTIDPEHLAAYNSLCDFKVDSQPGFVPITYPLILFFKLQSLLLLSDTFPFPGLGLVHLANEIVQMERISSTGTSTHSYNATVYCEESVQRHKKGYCFTVVSELYRVTRDENAADVLVWRSRSTVLSQCTHSERAEKESKHPITPYLSLLPEAEMSSCAGETTWKFAENIGRQFAALSCDYNPIHINRLTAALFGFIRGHIIHGMCTCAQALANIQCEDDEAKFFVNTEKGDRKRKEVVTFYVEFKTPVYLPGEVMLQTALGSKDDSDLVDRESGGTELVHVIETCFLQVMNAKRPTLPHVKGFISYDHSLAE